MKRPGIFTVRGMYGVTDVEASSQLDEKSDTGKDRRATSQSLPEDPPKGPPTRASRRGTTNGNVRGGSDDRRRRREWLVETYRADTDVISIELHHGPLIVPVLAGTQGARPACRCYRCGELLTSDTVTVDRIKPGCRGGTYRRENIRPACGRCNSETGATVRRKSR